MGETSIENSIWEGLVWQQVESGRISEAREWPQETKKEPRDNLLHKGGSSGDMKEKHTPENLEI